MNTLRRKNIVYNLNQLVENFRGLREASAFLQSEGVEWYEADRTYVDNLKSWMSVAESVLASSGRIAYVEDWSKASDFEITVSNVYDYGERMKILLDSLKNSIEAEISNDEGVPDVQRNVFLSYSAHDEEEANTLYEKIKEANGTAFQAQKSLKPGDDFAEKIRLRILASEQLWLLVSPDSLKSDWVMTEWAAAWVLGKKIVPILLQCRPEDLPDRLRKLHCIEFDKHDDLINDVFRTK